MSEKELGQKWDRCLADCAAKIEVSAGPSCIDTVLGSLCYSILCFLALYRSLSHPLPASYLFSRAFSLAFNIFNLLRLPCGIIDYEGAGLGLGIVFSVVFFKRRTWPISFGTGAGLGMSYSNCQNDLRSHYLLYNSIPKKQ